ncbi:TIR domain-containing protein [Spirosoma linguale]|uniref:TIR domain-containing protein n=1 Tax=Spirosoma linguale (strain ATCC 33905 / DSM 74 / LMG 10896 / Claus 1) TaxID=504472 RepID=D2QBV8_SPILD|nr:hypothetical protein Slin_1942 [Spirosoma linguale DSM 74]
MKLFLSWSGPVSHKIATVFRDWIPLVLQSVEPYVSSEDIDKGTRWSSDIAKELEESRYGIICVTHQNLKAPWVNFEAGALSKTIEKSNVAPFLFNIKKSEVDGPLLQFQLTVYDREDIKKLINSINNASDTVVLDQPKLEKIFAQWWPSLESSFEVILQECKTLEKADKTPQQKEPVSEAYDKILEELLELTRLQVKILKNPEELLPPKYLAYALRESPPRRNSRANMTIQELHSLYRHLREITRSTVLENQEEYSKKMAEVTDIVNVMGDQIEYLYRRSRDIESNFM